MSNTTLTDRYIHAATRAVPERTRADVTGELRASIGDQVDALTEAGAAREDAERAVLEGLGDPDSLAAGYTDRSLHLIGPRYFLAWRLLIKVLLWSVLPAAGGAVALGQVVAGAPVGTAFGTVIVTVQLVALHLFFWTTLVFALIERSDHAAPVLGPWTPDDLPEPTAQGVGRIDMVATLVVLGICVAAIVWDCLVGFTPGAHGPLPLLNPALWPWWIAGLCAVMAGQAVVILAAHRARRWTFALGSTQMILGGVVAGAAIWLLRTGELVNPDWIAEVGADIDAEARRVIAILTVFVIAGTALWGAIDSYRKAFAARRLS